MSWSISLTREELRYRVNHCPAASEIQLSFEYIESSFAIELTRRNRHSRSMIRLLLFIRCHSSSAGSSPIVGRPNDSEVFA